MEFTLCMIVKNEEDVLARCLDSIQDIAAEIVIADTGSTDSTREIAARYTSKVYDFPWCGDFSAARNFSLSKATKPYCMWLDADDVILPADRELLKVLTKSLPEDTDMVMLPYHTAFDSEGKPTFTYYRERIVRNSPLFQFKGAVHECITPTGNVRYEQAAVTHSKVHPSDPDRNLNIFRERLRAGFTLDPREQYYYARELYYHQLYDEAISEYEAFLDGGLGWVENNIDACRYLSYCYYNRKRPQKALQSLFTSFSFDLPRAEICCDLGKHYLDQSDYPKAAYWYERALDAKMDATSGGFVEPDCYGYTPCLQLCVCYYRMGDVKRSIEMNERAASFKPSSEACAFNKNFFENRKEKP